MGFLGTRNNTPKVSELRQLWDTTWSSHRIFEETFDVAQVRSPTGTIRIDDQILVRPRNHNAERLLVALCLDSPERFLELYGQELKEVPVVGKVRPNKLPYLGITVNKRNMTALLTGFNEEIQVDILQGMNRIEEAFWTSMTVTAYLAERRAGGLKEIPPALLARKRAVDLAVEHMLKTTPGIQTIRLGGIGVGSGDEMVQIGQMLMAEGKSVEVRALELNRELVSEANRALQKTQIAGEVVHGSMNRSMDLQRICSFEPHLIVDHWAGCYDSLPIQKARFALIHEQLPQTAILFAAITDEWGVGKMIAGERQRNTETVQALSGGVEQMAGGIIHHMGHTYYVYPSQLELIQRLHASDSWLATQRSAVYGWLSTLLPREIAFGPKALILPDGQDALRVSAPYGAALQVWSCRYPLGILQNAATSTGWNLSYGEETLFGAGAALLFV